MTRRSDIVKIFAIAAVLAKMFYYLAYYGLACPENVCHVTASRGCALDLLAYGRRSFERCHGQSCYELHKKLPFRKAIRSGAENGTLIEGTLVAKWRLPLG
jgi:hypothetical protein